MGKKLSAAQKRALVRDGYVLVPKLVPPARVAAARREVNHRIGTGKHPNVDPYSGTLTDYLSERLTEPALMDLAKGPVRELVEDLLGAGRVHPTSDAQIALRFPSGRTEAATEHGSHVDWPGGDNGAIDAEAISRTRYALNVGILLSDLPRPDMGNLVVYPGSYRLIAARIKKEGLKAMDGVTRAVALPKPVQITGKAGDAVLFHFSTAHAVADNASPHIRVMAYFRFWHLDGWYDRSAAYLERALSEPWHEWAGLRGVK